MILVNFLLVISYIFTIYQMKNFAMLFGLCVTDNQALIR